MIFTSLRLFFMNGIGLNGGVSVLNQENGHSSEASAEIKNIHSEKETNGEILSASAAAADGPPKDTDGAPEGKPSGISLASMEARLEALPEVERLTAELLRERKNPPATPERPKKARQAEKNKAEGSGAGKTAAAASVLKADEAAQSAQDAPVSAAESPRGSQKKPRRSRTAAIIRTALLTAAVVVLGLIGVEAFRVANIVNSVNYVKSGGFFGSTEMVVSESAIAAYVSHSDETKNVLLVGYDVDESGVSRSDSMIILTLDHEHQKIKMTSLMRDMYVQIPGYGRHKLNAAFVYGGPELLLQTIYANFGLQIDNYVCVDYAAFVDVVDYIGGVQIDIEEIELEQFNKYVRGGEKNRIYEAGSYVFNGQQTLSYCRIRKVGSDTARTARQRTVLGKIMKRCSGMSLIKLENLLRITAPAVTTNLTQVEIFRLAAEGLSSMDYDMQGMRIPVDGAWWDENINGTWYVGLDLNANARYLHDFIYGDSETSGALAASLEESDSAAEEREKASFERRKAKNN